MGLETSDRRSYRFLWLSDPWNKLDHPWDTTLRLLSESTARGNENYWCDYSSISWRDSNATIGARRIVAVHQPITSTSIIFAETEARAPIFFDRIIARVDPPITKGYVDALELLVASLEGHGKNPEEVLVNPPSVLLGRNDKLLASSVKDYSPPTIISCDINELFTFIRSEGCAVLKPLDQHQSGGIVLLNSDEANDRLEFTLRQATRDYTRFVVVQKYLRRHQETEKRVWFLDGIVIGYGLKRSPRDSFPLIMCENSYLLATDLTQHEQNSCEALGAFLQPRRIRLAGVDLIDGFITDVNVISPGLLVEMEIALNKNIASEVIRALEQSI